MSSSFPPPPRPLVLTFAASDPTGGAGLQADVLTIAAMGCHPLSVLTGFTVQDTTGVESVHPIAAERVRAQAIALLKDMKIAAVKLGVLVSSDNADAIGELLPDAPMVLDPVLASGRGDPLSPISAVKRLLSRCTVATPNTLEARALGGVQAMLEAGCRFVLLTGTHADTPEVVNVLHDRNGVVREDRWPRLPGSYHGSGCTLASAIAAALAKGRAMPEAVREAQEFTWNSLKNGFRPGAGQAMPWR
jgi:hydroxymethylpyrimidine/phosphomethylpyrimidine kinase